MLSPSKTGFIVSAHRPTNITLWTLVQATLQFQGEPPPTYILNEDTHPVIRAIGVSHTACKCEFRQNLRSHSWSVILFLLFVPIPTCGLEWKSFEDAWRAPKAAKTYLRQSYLQWADPQLTVLSISTALLSLKRTLDGFSKVSVPKPESVTVPLRKERTPQPWRWEEARYRENNPTHVNTVSLLTASYWQEVAVL